MRRISLAFTDTWRAAWRQCSARRASSTDEQLEHKVLVCWAELSDSEALHSCRGQRVHQNWRHCTLFDWRTEARMQAVEVLSVVCPQTRRDSPARTLDATARQHLILPLLQSAGTHNNMPQSAAVAPPPPLRRYCTAPIRTSRGKT